MFYLEYRSLEQSYFQLQFVYVNIDRILRSDILCYYQRLRRRLNYLEHSTDVHKRMNETNPPVEPRRKEWKMFRIILIRQKSLQKKKSLVSRI